MIYLEATLKIGPGKQREFNQLLKDVLIPANERQGVKLVAAWGNLTGLQDVVTDLWAYEDLAHLQRVQQDGWGSDPAFREAFRTLATLSHWETTKLLTPLRYHPADALSRRADKPGILMTARLKVNAGQQGAFFKLFRDGFLPLPEKYGMHLVGAFQTQVGPLAEILDLWRFEDIAAYWQAMRSLGGDPEARRLIAEIRAVAPDEEITLHAPLAYSPFR